MEKLNIDQLNRAIYFLVRSGADETNPHLIELEKEVELRIEQGEVQTIDSFVKK